MYLKVDLYIDDQLFVPTKDTFQVVEDFALPIIEGTDDTVFAIGACWHGKLNLITYQSLTCFHNRQSFKLIFKRKHNKVRFHTHDIL